MSYMLQHNFASNFYQAATLKDEALMDTVIKGELAKIIVSNKEPVIVIIKKAGVPISSTAKNTQIAKEISKNIKNQKLNDGIADLVINYVILESGANGFKSVDGKTPVETFMKSPSVKKRLMYEFNRTLNNSMNADGNGTSLSESVQFQEQMQNIDKTSAAKKKLKPLKNIGNIAIGVSLGLILFWLGKRYIINKFPVKSDSQQAISSPVPVAESNVAPKQS